MCTPQLGQSYSNALVPMLLASSSAACACGLADGRCSVDAIRGSWPGKSVWRASCTSAQAHQSHPLTPPIPASSSSASSSREMRCRTGQASQPPCLTPSFTWSFAHSPHAPPANTFAAVDTSPPPRAPPALTFFRLHCVCASPPPFVYRRTEQHRAPSFHSLPILLFDCTHSTPDNQQV